MSIRGKVLALSAVAFAAAMGMAAPAQAAAKADDAVIAVVNGSKITKQDVTDALSQAPGKKLTDDELKFIFPKAVEMLVNEKLMDQAIAKSKIEQSDDYKKRLEFMKGQLAKQLYLQDYLKDKVTEKDIQSEYAKFKKENEGKLEVHADQIVVPTKVEAEQVVKDLAAGKKFADLARQRSADAESAQHGGDIGWFAKDELPTPFQAIADEAFKLKPGQYSKTPVKSDFGWHVIKVEGRRERKVPTLDQVENGIRQKLSQDAIAKMMTDLRKQAKLQFFDLKGKPMTAAEMKADASKGKPLLDDKAKK